MTAVIEHAPVRLASIAAQPPEPAPVATLIRRIHALLDSHPGHDATPAAGGYARLIGETERAIRRLQALKLRVLAAADTADVSAQTGLVDTGAWLAKHTHTAGPAAAGQVALAQDLASLPATTAAIDSGGLSVEHASVIAQTTRRLPARLTAHQRDQVEAKLVGLAGQLDPPALRRRARRVLHDIASREEAEQHHAEQLRDEEQRALARTRLVLHDNSDGTTSGHFTVPTLAGSILRKVLQQMTSPRRQRATMRAAEGEVPDHAHAHGLAFVELLEHLPTDRLHGKVAPRSSSPCNAASSSPTWRQLAWTPEPNCLLGTPADWPVGPASCRPSSPGPHCPWIWVGPSGSSPKPNARHSPLTTPPVLPKTATVPLPGPNSTTNNPGAEEAAPISPMPSPCAVGTTGASTIPVTPMPDNQTARSPFTGDAERALCRAQR